ncbi:MAG TPA: hypothetical protein VNS63_01045, partial [Blastocatellia bacterium]|nr:hypothetical protein [Blastocatellia bacterium]
LSRISAELLALMDLVEGADVTPTSQAVAASGELQRRLAELLSRWSQMRANEVKGLNEQLRQANLSQIELK